MRKKQYVLNKPVNNRITQNIRRFLKRKGWTVERMATESELDASNVYNMFNGKINYTIRALMRLSSSLQIDIGEFFKK